ncbi:unnamed protein product [Closterium sp. NIES-54]
MTSSSLFDNDALPRNAANYAPLTPLTFIRRAADVHGDRCAVVYGDQSWTWLQTYRRCCKLASALRRRGIGKNDTVRPSVRLSVHPSSVRPSVHPSSVRPSVHPSPVRPSVRPSVHPSSVRPSVRPSVHPSSVRPSVRLSVESA